MSAHLGDYLRHARPDHTAQRLQCRLRHRHGFHPGGLQPAEFIS
ncbi:MAG TPA: hypothetical protein PKY36_07995 [Opitutaceae bacterium]|nr:hypothetical protein [Opitutaceae bacterium]